MGIRFLAWPPRWRRMLGGSRTMGRMPDARAVRRSYGDRMSHAIATPSTTTLGRLGAWAADHRRLLVVVWGVAVLALGALAPFADRALSGAGWEAPGSESGEARRAIESRFPGRGTYALSVVVAGEPAEVGDGPMRAAVAGVRRLLHRDPAVTGVLAPQPGVTVSRD